jgi:organic hydroperoxide reductase OsmC/OhrA
LSRPSTSTPLGLTRDVAVDLMNRAHEACPYSRATRGNVEFTLTLGGATIERQAA